jgi:hypothetical protein
MYNTPHVPLKVRIPSRPQVPYLLTKVRAHCSVFGKRPSHSLWREPSPKLTIPALSPPCFSADCCGSSCYDFLVDSSCPIYKFRLVSSRAVSQQLDFNDLSHCFRIYKISRYAVLQLTQPTSLTMLQGIPTFVPSESLRFYCNRRTSEIYHLPTRPYSYITRSP